MKTLSFDSIKVDGSQVTITGTISDKVFAKRTQQVTVNEYSAKHAQWARNFQISSEAVFVKRAGCNTFAVAKSEFSKLARTVEPTLSWKPHITKQPVSVQAVGSGTASFSVESVSEDSAMTYQWQTTTDNGKTWTDVAGATGATYSTTTAGIFRCSITNSVGTSHSKAAQFLIKPLPPAPTPVAQPETAPAK
jgi:hypothetical protein